jgi:hypothetical protein
MPSGIAAGSLFSSIASSMIDHLIDMS